MHSAIDLDAIAREVQSAQDEARQIEPLTTRWPDFDLAAAYAVADRIHRARMAAGARPVGRKIGFTNPAMWSRYGVREPIWATIYDATVVQLEGTRAQCRLGRFTEPKIEPEIVLRFRAAPQAGLTPAQLLETIDWVAHGFEIVQSHFPGWCFNAPDTVADWSLHGTLLVGPPQSLARLGGDVVAALELFRLTLVRDGSPVETGVGSNVLGSPLKAIAHLLAVLERQPYEPLRAGEIVTTGTITTAHTVRAGETWRSELDGIGLPGLTVEFRA